MAAAFPAEGGRLRQIAYRVLGSHADAEDVVQEAWLRLSRQDARGIDNLAGWLTTVVGRISLDVLRSGRARPETPLGEQLPELAVAFEDGGSPEEDAALADAVGLALLAVLDSLAPAERLAFVLHDMFAVPFEEIGQILGKSAAAAKMTASRARRKVHAGEQATAIGREQGHGQGRGQRQGQREVVRAFLAATRQGDFEGLLRVLDPEVRLTVETPGGVAVILGATRVAAGAQLSAATAAQAREILVNGLPGVVSWRQDGTPLSVIAFTVDGQRIIAITAVTDLAKLAAMPLPPLPESP